MAELNRITIDTERISQMISWGLMQIMGSVARESGFHDGVLCKLIWPNANLDIGCKLIRRIFDRYADIDKVVAAYNAGSARYDENGAFVNQDYVDKVMNRYRQITT